MRTVHAIKDDAIDLALLRSYLVDHADAMMAAASDRTLFAKAVCLYDYLRYAVIPPKRAAKKAASFCATTISTGLSKS